MKIKAGAVLVLMAGFATTYSNAAENLDGETLYSQSCAMCHTAPADDRTPRRNALASYTANSVFRALTEGVMAPQGAALSNEQKIALAEHLTGTSMQADNIAGLARCDQSMPALNLTAAANWNGWGNGLSNPRYQSSAGTHVNAGNIANMELAWALGLDNASVARAQPSVISDVVFMGSTTCTVYALD